MSHVRSEIDDLLTGRVLAAEAEAKLHAHLKGCPDCRAHYDTTLGLLRLARGADTAPAPGELQRLQTRAIRLAREVPGAPSFPWRVVFAGAGLAAAVALTLVVVSSWPRSPVGSVLAASRGLRLDGVAAGKDAVIYARAVVTTEKEDAALLLESAKGRRGVLLRPNSRVVAFSSGELGLEAGRVRVQVRKTSEPFVVRGEGLQVVQPAAGTFVVERRASGTLVAVHQGTALVRAGGQELELKEGQETEVSTSGALLPAKPASASALVEDRGTVWDAILRFLRQLLDVIAQALSRD